MPYDELVRAAIAARQAAYAPYSGYKVGAAALSSEGHTYSGCNCENVSYPACICAERAAIVAMIAAGQPKLSALAIVTSDGATPCGLCLQVISEFAEDPSIPIITVDESGNKHEYTFANLMPFGFRSQAVSRTE